jgi:TonB family protein
MLNYITGDVIIDAVVHANGQVGEMKVLTGPAALREAATAALRQYQYQPATEGGKAVASHVKVTVKFWFNP